MGLGTNAFGLLMVRLGSVSCGIGLLIPTLPSAKIVLVLYDIKLEKLFQQPNIPGLKIFLPIDFLLVLGDERTVRLGKAR
jgi:hypothetical protein